MAEEPSLLVRLGWDLQLPLQMRHRAQQFAQPRNVGGAARIGEQPVMTDAVKALRQDVEHKAADELVGRQRHDLAPCQAVRPVVLVAEGDAALIMGDEPRVRDGHPVGVARQIGEHRLRPRERLLDVDEPLLPAQRFERCGEGGGRRQLGEAALQSQKALAMDGGKLFQHQTPEQPRQHPDRQEETAAAAAAGDKAFAVKREPAAGNDHMHMRMMRERRSPSMKHCRDADPGAEMLGIGGNGEHGLGRRLEEKAVDFRLVLPGYGADRRGQREHHVVIGQGQKLGLAVRKPLAGSCSLALRAVPVAAGVVADDGVSAVFAARDMAAKLRRAAGFDGGHCFQLPEAQMPGVGLAPGCPVAAEDVRNLKRGTRHGPRRLRLGLVLLLLDQAEPVQRAHHFADRACGHARVKRRRVELGVAEQHLDDTDIDILLQKMGRKAVPQRVQGDALVDLRQLGRHVADAVQLACGHGVDRVLAWKQPGARPADAPPLAQDIEQHRRQHCEAILAPLALLDAEQHARAIDIGDLQRDNLGGPEPRAIGDAQRRLILGAGRRIEQAGDFILGQHRGQLPGLLDAEQRLAKLVPVERDAEEEPKRSHGRVHAGCAKRALNKMEAVEPQILRRRRLGGAADERRKVLDAADVVLLRLLSEMARGHVVDHALTKRADTHTELLLRMRLTPHSQAEPTACLDVQKEAGRDAAAYRESGFVLRPHAGEVK